jgi:hypothetical protein
VLLHHVASVVNEDIRAILPRMSAYPIVGVWERRRQLRAVSQ